MANKRIYSHSRFDGGMTHNKRDTSDLTKFALISHLDIYRDRNEMHVMPGYVSDDNYNSTPNGLRAYNIQAFSTAGFTDRIFALGKKLDGTGSKIFWREYADSEWEVPSGGLSALATEGTHDLVDYPFLWWNGQSDFNFPIKDGSNTRVAILGPNAPSGNYQGNWQAWLSSSIGPARTYQVQGFTGTTYITQSASTSPGVATITSSAVTLNTKSSSLFIGHIASGDYQIGIAGQRLNPRRGQVLLWDSASLLADQNVAIGKGIPFAIGFPSNIWAAVSISTTDTAEAIGKSSMAVRVIQGESPDIFFEQPTVSAINQSADVFATNETYSNAMMWYAKLEVKTGEYLQGVWGLGKGDVNSQFGASMLLDTTSLGLVRNIGTNGNAMWFIHGGDGSVSRLANFETGTYNVPATIETLIYGADSPYQKELNGISIITENLPSGGSVVCSYRTDEDSAWVEMGTSDTTGKQKHSFTKANGTPIGKFQEIQFKIVITGKVTVKNILVAIEESNDLPF
jgi:hypothetical protein